MEDELQALDRLLDDLENGKPGDPRDLAAVLRMLNDRAPMPGEDDLHTEGDASPVNLAKK